MHNKDELNLVMCLPDDCLFSRGPLHILYTTTLSYNGISVLMNPMKIIDLSTDLNIVTSLYHKATFFNQKIKFILPYFCRKQLSSQTIEICEDAVLSMVSPEISTTNTVNSIMNITVAPTTIHICQDVLTSSNVGLLEKIVYALIQNIPTVHVYDLYPSTKYVAPMLNEVANLFNVEIIQDANHYIINQNETSLQKAQQYNEYLKTKYPAYILHIFTDEYDTTMAEAFSRLEAIS